MFAHKENIACAAQLREGESYVVCGEGIRVRVVTIDHVHGIVYVQSGNGTAATYPAGLLMHVEQE